MEKKTVIKFFDIMQYKAEEEYLRNMHRAGWELVSVSGLCVYRFKKCEPQDVIYRLDYNQNGISHKDEYVKLFNDCGWEYLQDYVGYSYFRKPADDESDNDDIFCDDESRLQMLSRVFKGRMIPPLIILFCVVIPQLYFGIQNEHPVIAVLYGVILVIYLSVFTRFGIGYMKLKNNIKK